MRRIFSIYRRDMKNLFTSPAALIMLTALALLPSLYAWFNIEASWDPYGNTRGIQVAVVNQDAGSELLGKPVHVGDEVIASLKQNDKIGWVFTTEQKALSGVRHGDYYASLIIPEAFSRDIASVLSKEPVEAKILYYVNEKINAIAPKITSKGASGIVEEVSATFVQTASEALFRLFNELGIELTRELPVIEKTKSLIFQVESLLPTARTAVDTAAGDLAKAEAIVGKAEQALPVANDLLANGEAFATEAAQAAKKSRALLTAAEPYIRQDLIAVQGAAEAVSEAAGQLADESAEPTLVDAALSAAIPRLEKAAALTLAVGDFLAGFERFGGASAASLSNALFASERSELNRLNELAQEQLALLKQIQAARGAGKRAAAELLNRLSERTAEAARISGSLVSRYDSTIAPKVKTALDRVDRTIGDTKTLLDEATAALPDIQKLLQDAAKGIIWGTTEAKAIQAAFPSVEEKVHGIANRIRAFEQQGHIQDIINLLVNDFEKKSAFFAHPVTLVENKLYPIPNYGSAMSPFFTTLSLWVGALLLVSLLSVEVDDCPGGCRHHEVYFGRYLLFLQTALLQALFVTLGDRFLLGTYVHDLLYFVLFGLLLSAVFMLIVYTLVSVFGNVGKAIAIILLVLQLAGSGGTFPIQVTPPFFQAIYPYLPFTYGISMMREAVGGILWDVVWRDLVHMAVYAAIALLLGLALKAPINRASAKFVASAKKSKLIH